MLTHEDLAEIGLDPNRLFARIGDDREIALAVSGGVDSLALLLLMDYWCRSRSCVLHVFSVDHGLRTEAAAEVAFVGEVVKKLGHEFHPLKWHGGLSKSGLQAAARAARYALIAEQLHANGIRFVVTGHHLEDQAETVLMRMAHSSGLRGVGGMAEHAVVNGVKIERPLLAVPKSKLQAVVRAAGLQPVADPSNEDEAFERVRWRKFMPAIADLGIDAQTLGLFSRRMQRAEDALAALAFASANKMSTTSDFGTITIRTTDFFDCSDEIAIRILRLSVAPFCVGDQLDPPLHKIERLYDRLTKAKKGDFSDGFVQCVGGAVVKCDGNVIVLARETGRELIEKISLDAGRSQIWDQRFWIDNGTADVLHISADRKLTRAEAENFVGSTIKETMDMVRVAPLVRDAAGQIVGLGCHTRIDGLKVVPAPEMLWPRSATYE